jgi:tetratricopeptide (TPR) repeat protein
MYNRGRTSDAPSLRGDAASSLPVETEEFLMLGCARSLFALLALLLAGLSVQGQDSSPMDIPRLFVPKQPPTRQELDRREALKKYADGMLYEREDRLLEALKAYEDSSRLDSEAPAVFKAQVGLLLALDRIEEAVKACRRGLDLDPNDPELWYVAARIHKAQGQQKEAQAALRKALATEQVKEHPEQAQQLWLDLGELYEATQDYASAADAYTHAALILEHPDTILEKGNFSREAIVARAAETYERIGNLYRKAGKYDQAIDALRKAQQKAPERAGRISFHLAELCRERGRPAEALKHVDAYLQQQPLGLEAYEMKIDLLRQLKQASAMLPWLEQAARVDKHNTGLHLLLAREYARAGQVARAEGLYRELAESGPSPELYRGWFQLYKEQPGRILDMLNQAITQAAPQGVKPGANLAIAQAKAMVAALREEGELARPLVQTAFRAVNKGTELQFETLHFLAVLADRHRLGDEAERFYRSCLNQPPPPAMEALVYGGLLRTLNRARKFEDTIKVCEQGLTAAQTTNKLLFFNDLARACAQLERYEEALRHVDQAVALAGEDNKLVLKILRVRILSMAERYPLAEAECQALLKEYPLPGDTLEVRYVLSSVYTAAKQLDKAEEQLTQILRVDPNNATANNDLGYVWADQGKKLPEAEEMIRKALEQDRRQRKNSANLPAEEDKDNAAYVDSLGWVLFRRGRIEEARQELERATTLPESEDPVIWDHLGDVYSRLHQPEQARSAWERALRYYDQGHRRRADDRYHELQRKLKRAKDQASAR